MVTPPKKKILKNPVSDFTNKVKDSFTPKPAQPNMSISPEAMFSRPSPIPTRQPTTPAQPIDTRQSIAGGSTDKKGFAISGTEGNVSQAVYDAAKGKGSGRVLTPQELEQLDAFRRLQGQSVIRDVQAQQAQSLINQQIAGEVGVLDSSMTQPTEPQPLDFRQALNVALAAGTAGATTGAITGLAAGGPAGAAIGGLGAGITSAIGGAYTNLRSQSAEGTARAYTEFSQFNKALSTTIDAVNAGIADPSDAQIEFNLQLAAIDKAQGELKLRKMREGYLGAKMEQKLKEMEIFNTSGDRANRIAEMQDAILNPNPNKIRTRLEQPQSI